jgi:hypothetical protein
MDIVSMRLFAMFFVPVRLLFVVELAVGSKAGHG